MKIIKLLNLILSTDDIIKSILILLIVDKMELIAIPIMNTQYIKAIKNSLCKNKIVQVIKFKMHNLIEKFAVNDKLMIEKVLI